MAALSVGIASCDKEEPEPQKEETKKEETVSESLLVGTWRHNFSSGYSVKCFRANGTGYEQEYDEDDGGLGSKHNFEYTYNEKTGKLKLTYDEGDEIDDCETWIYEVVYLTSSTLELEDPDGYSDTYSRVN